MSSSCIKHHTSIVSSKRNNTMLAIFFVLLLCLSSQIEGQLRVGFYLVSCPNAEKIVREEVTKAFSKDRGVAAGLVRMHFHDCFLRGCDASVLIKSRDGDEAEEDGPPNAGSLRGFEAIESAKARLEKECRGLVSCADVLAYAARDSVLLSGGLRWEVPGGRRDGRISRADETFDMPAPFHNLDTITELFAKKNLSQSEMIALLGAHTIGISHCTSFSNRLYEFNSTNGQDPTLDRFYASVLKKQCPQNASDSNDVVQMNLTPTVFGNSYYNDVLKNRGLFTSDQTLASSPASLTQVQNYARNNIQWLQDFARAMIKMSQIEVLTGSDGEIRSNCRAINA